MLTAIETATRRIFQTQATTDYGLQDFWLDERCNWQSGIADSEYTEHLEDCQGSAKFPTPDH